MLLSMVSPFALPPPPPSLEKGLSVHFSLTKNRIYFDTHLKEKLTDLFSRVFLIPYSRRQRKQ